MLDDSFAYKAKVKDNTLDFVITDTQQKLHTTSGFAASVAGQSKLQHFAWPGCGSGLDKQVWALILNFNYTKTSAAVLGGQLENSTPAQSRGTL